MNFLAELRSRLRAALATLTETPDTYVEMLKPTTDPRFGDFQANCAMPLSKQLGRPARDIAQDLLQRLEVADLCDPPEVAGPGFLNLRLRTDRLAQATARVCGDDRLGVVPVAQPRTIVIDYSSPNVAKPMHVGHLRSTVIGHALYRILKFLGHTVISDNHVGDWGTQFGMIIYGYKHFRDETAYAKSPVAELARLYRLVNQLSDFHDSKSELSALEQRLRDSEHAATAAQEVARPGDKDAARQVKKLNQDVESAREAVQAARRKIATVESNPELLTLATGHPQIAELARRETARLHAGDAENKRLWDEFVPQCLAALEQVYARFGIKFDLTLGESWYNPMLAGIVDELRSRGLAVDSQGAVCVFVAGNDAPFLIQKADGAYTYATTDLATIRYRVETLHADASLYVVDARQSEHFQLLFDTARRMGYAATEFRHVSFGTVLGDDHRPFKTRSGDTVGLESLLDEAVQNARRIVDAKSSHLPEDERARVAELVGLGAVIYVDLHHNRDSDYIFSWEKMLATNGDTATYIQYAYARASGILRKGDIDVEALRQAVRNQPDGTIHLTSDAERVLALQLNRFSQAVADVAVDYRPNLLTQYLFETANVVAQFYDKCPVLKEPDAAVRTSRLLLCDATARVLKQGLNLLGIDVAEQI